MSCKPPKKIAMRLASLTALEKSQLRDYLLLERPTGYLQTVLALASDYSQQRRPQLPLDALETPSPCSYFTRNCISSRGIKIGPLRKYTRDALPGSTEPWTFNTTRGSKTPDPTSYTSHRFIGADPVSRTAPAFSFPLTPRTALTPVAGPVPGPNVYNSGHSSDFIKTTYPSYSMSIKYKQGKGPAPSPGPAHYHPAYRAIQRRNPSCNFPTGHRFNNARTF